MASHCKAMGVSHPAQIQPSPPAIGGDVLQNGHPGTAGGWGDIVCT